jgi:hypothetical protein
MAGGRDQPVNVVQAAKAGAGASGAASAVAAFDCAVTRADALTTQLARDLERCAMLHSVMARELASQAYNP